MSELKDQVLHVARNAALVLSDKNSHMLERISIDRLQAAKCDAYEAAEGIESLRALNAELVEALERSLSWLSSYPGEGALREGGPYEQARAALAKAKGEQK